VDLDAAVEAAGHGAGARVPALHALGVRATVLRDGKPVVDGDALEDQDAVAVEHLTGRLDLETLGIDFDLTRFQRAGERAGQSPAGRRDHIVQRGRARREAVRWHAVVLGHLGVDAERDRLVLGGEIGKALGSAEALDADAGDVGRLGHAHHASPRAGVAFSTT
jgi:hypothetical protein